MTDLDDQIWRLLQQNDFSKLSDAELMAMALYAEDIARSGGVGLAEGAIQGAGMPGDARGLIDRGIDWVSGQLGVSEETRARGRAAQAQAPSLFPTSGAIKGAVEGVTGEFYKPQTTAGQYANTIAAYLPYQAAMAGAMTKSRAQKLGEMLAKRSPE